MEMNQIRVLIVDDDKLARKGFISIMDWTKYGMKVVGDVQNGRVALEFIKNQPVNLVFVDIDMPEMNGIEFIERCKKEHAEIRFVVFTIYEKFEYAQAAIRLGVLDYISKIQLEVDDGDIILGNIASKYRKEQQPRDDMPCVDREKLEALKEAWHGMRWLFDKNAYNDLCVRTLEAGTDIRSVERIIITALHKLAEEAEGDFTVPRLQTVSELLDWLDRRMEEFYSSVLKTGADKPLYLILKAVFYVEEHAGENIGTDEIAGILGMSRSYFSSSFKKYTGSTFHDFKVKKRMEHAGELLRTTDQTVTDIAGRVGYDDIYYFNRVFAEVYQCSPTDYRQKHKK